ncbi:hypothetical protein CkaCkLH20_10973 [Colletotrichum karsti]|uniref:BTB domain-containing protein n=1 Tax=Colletotrichum karsti TaxID=1095194 RepID=A0A9P6LGL7_9PEZI|nr:uncharacterized protein CkaCkLH20_10973 [Colletotrichum karsti]KAF9871562.1 hypothetical protein CkaCkLH20_10973 [Colletotrichum karsti]
MANLPSIDYRELLQTGEFSDFTIKCHAESFPVHKAILCQNSAYFATLLRSSFKARYHLPVMFTDIDCDVLKHLLDYFYRGTTDWKYPREDIMMNVRLWILADRFQAYPAMVAVERNLVRYIDCQRKMAAAAKPDVLNLVFSHAGDGKKISAMTTLFGFSAWVTSCTSTAEIRSNIDAVAFNHQSLASMMFYYARHQINAANRNINKPGSSGGCFEIPDTASRLRQFDQLSWNSTGFGAAVQLTKIKDMWKKI